MKINEPVFTDTTKMVCQIADCKKSHKHMVEITFKKGKIMLCQNCYKEISRELELERNKKAVLKQEGL